MESAIASSGIVAYAAQKIINEVFNASKMLVLFCPGIILSYFTAP